MIDMMTNQEKTLESMFQAQNSLRKYIQAADISLDQDGDTASIFTSTTNSTALTAFDFDAVIKATAVYQRCMRHRDNVKSLSAIGSSRVWMASSSATHDRAAEEELDPTYVPSSNGNIATESVEWQEFCEAGFSERPSSESVRSDDLTIAPIGSSDTAIQGTIPELSSQRVPSTRLSGKSSTGMGASSRRRTSRLWYTDHSTRTQDTTSDTLVKETGHNSSRNVNYERVKQKLIGKLSQRQHVAPVVYGLDLGHKREHSRGSSDHIQEDTLSSVAESSTPTSNPSSNRRLQAITSTSNMDLNNSLLMIEDTVPRPVSSPDDVSGNDRRRSPQESGFDNKLERGLSITSSSSSMSGEPRLALDDCFPDSTKLSLQGVSEKHDSAALYAGIHPNGATWESFWQEPKGEVALTSTRLLYDHQEEITNLTISSKSILTAASANMIRLWNLSIGKEVVSIPCKLHSQASSSLTFSADGTILAAAHVGPNEMTTAVGVWASETGARLCALQIDNVFGNTAITISEDNRLIACGQEDKKYLRKAKSTIVLYDIATGRRVGKFPDLETPARMLSFIGADLHLLCCSKGRVEIWDVATYTLIRHWDYTGHTFYRTILTHDLMLVTSNGTKRADMYDLFSGVKKASVVLSESIRRMACSPGTQEIAFAGCNGLVGTWDPSTGVAKKIREDCETHLYGVAMSSDGQAIVYGGTDGLVRLRYIEDEDHGGFAPEGKE
jgi:hypothetical protein